MLDKERSLGSCLCAFCFIMNSVELNIFGGNVFTVIAALKKLGVRCFVTERNAERSEPLLVTTAEKACGTADGTVEIR